MPSPEHGADLERVLTRASKECETGAAWFGEGLPQALKSALDTAGKGGGSDSPKLAFVEIGRPADPPPGAARVIALSTGGIDELASVVRSAQRSKPRVTRLICPVAVLDFIPEGVRVREIRQGLTAADIQKSLDAPLWAGPDLKRL